MKRCFKCGVGKPPSEFYRHSGMAGGLLGKCKTCTRADVLAHRSKNIERIRAYDRERAALPHRQAHITSVVREWRRKHPERMRAQRSADYAVRNGRLKRPDRCAGCNETVRLEKHHPDYSKPLLVAWLCKPCHVIADKIRRRLEAS